MGSTFQCTLYKFWRDHVLTIYHPHSISFERTNDKTRMHRTDKHNTRVVFHALPYKGQHESFLTRPWRSRYLEYPPRRQSSV